MGMMRRERIGGEMVRRNQSTDLIVRGIVVRKIDLVENGAPCQTRIGQGFESIGVATTRTDIATAIGAKEITEIETSTFMVRS
jgi:hypothetical protein